MARLDITTQRPTNIVKPHFGKMLIFCEGQTEARYFQYFINKLKSTEKYFDVVVETVLIGGNAQAVFKHASNFLASPSNNIKYGLDYDKYLVFDCDAPPQIQSVIKEMLKANTFKLLLSNSLFEVWLLMHYESVTRYLRSTTIYKRLRKNLGNRYDKGDFKDIADIIEKGNVQRAINNAHLLELKYQKSGKTIENNIEEMNPYTNVFTLIEKFVNKLND